MEVVQMDYKTRPLSRRKIRSLSKVFRRMFGVDLSGPFPVLDALDKLPDIFADCNYEIVDDNSLPINVPANCSPNSLGGYTIQIKESVYNGVYYYGTGAYRDHIVHELSHVFLFSIGYTPIIERSFDNGAIKPYESSEWQAKALCGEIMMPYDETKNMSNVEIKHIYGVSEAQAIYRTTY